MDKNQCEDLYSEVETEEHVNGKRNLFEWIKKQSGVYDAILEGWLPETHQRPDIMFKCNGKQYVIEFQCTPIATEYNERHKLYKVAGIIDIWICGVEKYLKNKSMKQKYLSSVAFGFYDYKNDVLISRNNNQIYKYTKLDHIYYKNSQEEYYGRKLKEFCFNDTIYDKKIENPEVALQKHVFRNKNNYKEVRRRKNYYLNKQFNLDYQKFTRKLYKLERGSWSFICSDGMFICIPSEYNWFGAKKINIRRSLGIEKLKILLKNDELLKSTLAENMRENLEKALNYKSDTVRLLEVRR